MRILYVSQYYPPEMGAPAARVSQLARAWAADGHDVTVLTGFPNHPTGVVPPEYRGAPYIRTELDHGVRVIRTPIYAAANKGVLKRGLNYVSASASATLLGPFLTDAPDVVIGTSPQFLTAVAGYTLARLKRVPFVFEVRDLWPQSIVEVGAMPAGHPVIRALAQAEKFLYAHADRLVVVTDTFVDEIAAKGIDRSRIAVVKNGVDLDLFRPGPRDNAQRQSLSIGDRFLVSYIGTHGMAHGLGTLLDVARDMRGDDRVRFLFIGEGADKAALEQRARDEGLHNVIFLGQRPHAEIPAWVQASDALAVLLKAKDLFKSVLPSKVFEFMGCAKPILLGVDGEARRLVVDQARAGAFIPPESPEALAAAIRTWIDDPAERARMGERGRAFSEQFFSRRSLARHYLDILRAVVEERPHPAAPQARRLDDETPTTDLTRRVSAPD